MTDQTLAESELDSTQELSAEDALELMMERSDNTESQDQPVQDDKEAEDATEATDAEEEDTEETDTEGLTEEESDEAEESEEEPEPEIEYVTEGYVDIDGEAVDIQELKQGHLRQADYTRKTQGLADKRKEAEDKKLQYETQLNALSVATVGDLRNYENVDWELLKAQNPDRYKTALAEYQGIKDRANWLNNQIETFNQQQTQQQEAEQKAKADEARQTLKATIPNWSNELYTEIGKYAVTQGISQEDYDQIVDARLITVLHKGMLYDGAKVVTKKKIAKSPKKTLSGSKSAPKTAGNKYKQAMQNLNKSGSFEDGLAALTNMNR